MINAYLAKHYQMTEVNTADQKRLILMCYEGAIERLQKGKERILDNRPDERTTHLSKAREIITELQCALNFEKGGQIAKNLNAIYTYILKRIFEADVKNDISAIDEVLVMLRDLKSAWEYIFKNGKVDIPEPAIYQEQRSYVRA